VAGPSSGRAFEWQGLRDALHHSGYAALGDHRGLQSDAPDISYPAAVRRKQVPANAEAGHRGLAVLQSLFAQ